MQTEVRKLPKKTIFIITFMVILAVAIFSGLSFLKKAKLTEVLQTIGHSDIKDLTVINKLSVEDTQTRYKSTVFKVMFFDNTLNKTCIGFIHKEKNSHYTKDIDCK
ncbi:MAG: hypothetical protein R2837_05220 [Aliarcobacter sp.]